VKGGMAARPADVWWLLVLLLTTGVVGVLSDPFFDHFSGEWQHARLEGEAAPRPAWRIPGTIETPCFTPVLLSVALVTPADPCPGPPVLARRPFIPPRSWSRPARPWCPSAPDDRAKAASDRSQGGPWSSTSRDQERRGSSPAFRCDS